MLTMNEELKFQDETKIITGREFYEESIKCQRRIIKEYVEEAMRKGNPMIYLPFDTYPDVEAEMEANGWEYDQYDNESGKACAMFYPKQYNYDYEE